jgi:hypothetical protein
MTLRERLGLQRLGHSRQSGSEPTGRGVLGSSQGFPFELGSSNSVSERHTMVEDYRDMPSAEPSLIPRLERCGERVSENRGVAHAALDRPIRHAPGGGELRIDPNAATLRPARSAALASTRACAA